MSTTGSGVACTPDQPCDLPTALGQWEVQDTIELEAGTYSLASTLTVLDGATVRGVAGQARPVLSATLDGPVVSADASGATLNHLVIRQSKDTAPALHAAAVSAVTPISLNDLVVEATGAEGVGAQLGANAVMTNSVVRATDASTGTAIQPIATGAELHNVTAWASGTHGVGIQANPAAILEADNTIARAPDATSGQGGGVFNPDPLMPAALVMTNSNFTQDTAGGALNITGAGNQSAAPLLADPANGDFHELNGSPTINAGIADPLSEPTDPDGDPRTLGLRPDIGADEYVPRAPTATTGDPIGITTTGGTFTGTVDPRGLATTYRFEYGATPLYGAATPTADAGSGNGPVPVSAPLGNLQPGSVLHYRLVASNSDGESAGGDRTLIVAAAQPINLTQPSITQVTPPQNPTVGSPVTFTVSGADSDDAVNSITIDFGDGPGFFAESACRLRPASPIFTTSHASSFTVPYTFTRAGAHTVTITVGSGDCGSGAQTTTQTVSVNVGAAKTAHARVRAREMAVLAKTKGCKGANLLPTAKNHTKVENATICLLNKQRKANKRGPLRKNKKLRKAAALHNGYMTRGRFFAHQGPGEPALGARFRKVKYAGGGGENLGVAVGLPYSTPRSMVIAWMNSPIHRANILERAFHTIGLAVMARKPETPQTPGVTYTTEFGTTKK